MSGFTHVSTLRRGSRPAVKHRAANRACLRQAGGRTLIELLVAMVIGLLMLGVIGAVYLNARQGTRTVDQNAQLQDAGRFALAAMGRELRQSGWSPIMLAGNAVTTGRRMANTAGVAGSAPFDACRGGYASPTTALDTVGGCVATPAAAAADAFTVRYMNDAGHIQGGTSCDGVAVAAGGTVFNRFYIATNANTGRAELLCNGAPFLDYVEDLRIDAVGYDAAPFDGVIDEWLAPNAANSVTAYANGAVGAVRLCILVASAEPVATGDFRYTDCRGTVNVASPDGRIRRTFWATIGLRNGLTLF